MKQGREDDFARAWLELGEQLSEDFPERKATLLHDRDQPNLFISFGRSDSLEVLEQRRASLAKQAESEARSPRTASLFEFVDNLDLHTLDFVGEIE